MQDDRGTERPTPRVVVIGAGASGSLTALHLARAARRRESRLDVVLLDVDNGPAQLVHPDNAAIYDEAFLRAVLGRLAPGGALVVWSAERAPELAETLRTVFGHVREHDHPVRLQDRDEHYWLYAARVASEA